MAVPFFDYIIHMFMCFLFYTVFLCHSCITTCPFGEKERSIKLIETGTGCTFTLLLTMKIKGVIFVCEESCTSSEKQGKGEKTHAYLTDECTELTRGETVIDASEDGNGDYNVAEETSEVVKGVYPD